MSSKEPDARIRIDKMLIEAGLIERLMIEVFPHEWNKYGIDVNQTLPTLAELLHGYTCIVACTGKSFSWNAGSFYHHDPNDMRFYDSPQCSSFWHIVANAQLGTGQFIRASDVYCVHNSLKVQSDPSYRLLTTIQ